MSLRRPEPVRIGPHTLGPGHPPFIIAEMSGNHNGSLDRALAIVDAAANAGAHAIKIQTYTAETMTLDIESDEFFIADSNSLWKGASLYKLYEQAHTPWEWHKAIFDRCRERGILGFSSPFDPTAVAFLETLNVPAYKIASFEIVDIPLIEKVASTGKPVIISTGMASLKEIEEAVEAARRAGCRELMLLKCTSQYPAADENINLSTIPEMAAYFGVPVGLSDHTTGIAVPVAAVALGAVAIEKHVTLRRSDGGVDSAFSLEPEELRSLMIETARAAKAVGMPHYGPTVAEQKSLQFRRSLYVSADIPEGGTLTPENMRSIRPGYGLPPKYYAQLLGQRVKKAVPRGTALSWDLLRNES